MADNVFRMKTKRWIGCSVAAFALTVLLWRSEHFRVQAEDIVPPLSGTRQVGLGVEWKLEKGTLRVIKVLAASPAERAGLAKGDRVLAIEGAPASELTADKLAMLIIRAEAPLLLTVASDAEAVRPVRLMPGVVEFPTDNGTDPVVVSAPVARALTRDQQAAEDAFKRRIIDNIERLREPVPPADGNPRPIRIAQ